jgi:hypothetical protein
MSENNNFIIRHASVQSDRSYPKAFKFYKKNNETIIYPSVIYFAIGLTIDDAIAWMKSKAISYETSYGSKNTRFDPWPIKFLII